MSTRLFFDDDGRLDFDRIAYEAVPLARLVALVGAVAFVPFAIGYGLGDPTGIGLPFVLLGQFLLAVGSGVVLLYVIVRGLRIADGR